MGDESDKSVRGLWLALALDTLTRFTGLAFAEGDRDTILGARVLAVVIAVVLGLSIARGRRWPRWALAAQGVISLLMTPGAIASDANLAVVFVGSTLDVAVLVVLWRTWPRTRETTTA